MRSLSVRTSERNSPAIDSATLRRMLPLPLPLPPAAPFSLFLPPPRPFAPRPGRARSRAWTAWISPPPTPPRHRPRQPAAEDGSGRFGPLSGVGAARLGPCQRPECARSRWPSQGHPCARSQRAARQSSGGRRRSAAICSRHGNDRMPCRATRTCAAPMWAQHGRLAATRDMLRVSPRARLRAGDGASAAGQTAAAKATPGNAAQR